MIPDLAQTKNELLEAVQEMLDDPIFLLAITHPDIDSKVLDNKLYWNLGYSQGYVVIDPKNKEVYRVYDTDKNKEPLTKNSLCDPATAQLVLDDIISLIDFLSEELDGVILEEVLEYLPPTIPPGSSKIM